MVFYYSENDANPIAGTTSSRFGADVYDTFYNIPDLYLGEYLPTPSTVSYARMYYIIQCDTLYYSQIKDKYYLQETDASSDGASDYSPVHAESDYWTVGTWGYSPAFFYTITTATDNNLSLSQKIDDQTYSIIALNYGAFVFYSSAIYVNNYLSTGEHNYGTTVSTGGINSLIFNTQITDTLFLAQFDFLNGNNYHNYAYGIKFYLELPNPMSEYYNADIDEYYFSPSDIDTFRIYYIDNPSGDEIEWNFSGYNSSFYYDKWQVTYMVSQSLVALAWDNPTEWGYDYNSTLGVSNPFAHNNFFIVAKIVEGNTVSYLVQLFSYNLIIEQNRLIQHVGGTYNDHAPTFAEVKANDKWYNYFIDALYVLEDLYNHGVDIGSSLPALVLAVNNAIAGGDQLLIDLTMSNIWNWFVSKNYNGIVDKIINNDELSPNIYRGHMWFSHNPYDDKWYIVGRGDSFQFEVKLIDLDNTKIVVDVPRISALYNIDQSLLLGLLSSTDIFGLYNETPEWFEPILRLTFYKEGANYIIEALGFSVAFYISPAMVAEFNEWKDLQ
jgi:hypothetical protein